MYLVGLYEQLSDDLTPKREERLQEFRQKLLTLTPSIIKKIDLPTDVALFGGEHLKKFHIRLLTYLLMHLNEATSQNELLVSIRIYFALKAPLEFASDAQVQNFQQQVYSPDFDLKRLIELGTEILTPEHSRRRNALRIHRKFLGVPSREGAIGETVRAIEQDIERQLEPGVFTRAHPKPPITLDGKPASACITALYRKISDINATPSTIYFQLAETSISWEGKKNHGRVFVHNLSSEKDISSLRGKDWKAAQAFNDIYATAKYRLPLIETLKSIEARIKTPLLALLIQRFSTNIQPFFLQEFSGILNKDEVHLLNLFAFITQIMENARYLSDGLDQPSRPIEDHPISIALALAKRLHTEGDLSLEELYTQSPVGSEADLKSPSKLQKAELNGLDPVSGTNLRENAASIEKKITKLSEFKPGFLHNIRSAASVKGLLIETYGPQEADGNESDFSLNEECSDQLPTSEKSLTEQIDELTLGAKERKEQISLPESP